MAIALIGHELDRVLLNVWKKFLTSPYLNLRVKGASSLSETIDRCVSRSNKISSPNGQFKLIQKSLDTSDFRPTITVSGLEEWLLASDVPLIMVGEESSLHNCSVGITHLEVFRRAENVLVFLADRGKLTAAMVRSLCDKCSKKYPDSINRVSYAIIGSLIPKVGIEILRVMYDRLVRDASLEEVDVFLVKNVVIAALLIGCTEEDFGIETLWRLIGIKDFAKDALAEVLSMKVARFQLKLVLEKIFMLINGHDRESSFSSLLLLRTLLLAQSIGYHLSAEDADREETIVYANETFHLKEILLQGIEIAVSADESVEYLETRLSMLGFILENSPLEISYEELISIWMKFRNSSDSLCETMLKWLAGILPGDPRMQQYTVRACLSDETLTRFFAVVMRADSSIAVSPEICIDFKTIGLGGYLCAEKLFRLVNGRNRAISHALNKQFYVVESDNFFGISTIFRFVVESSCHEVVASATNFLVDLQCHLSSNLKRFDVWSNFVTKSMAALIRFGETESPDPEDNHRKVSRILALILDLLSAIKKPMLVYNNEVGDDEVKLTIYLKTSEAIFQSTNGSLNVPMVYVFKRRGLTIGALRSRLANDLSHPPECIKMILQGQVLSLYVDAQELDPQGRASQIFLEVVILNSSEEDDREYVRHQPCRCADEEPSSDQMQLRYLLSSRNEYFSCLFKLLSCKNSSVVALAWQLLEQIPINPTMEAKILDFELQFPNDAGVDWTILLDGQRPFHLLYNLRIITSIVGGIKSFFSPVELRENSLQWHSKFLRSGGLNHIASLFTSTDLDTLEEIPLRKKNLASILQLIELFIVVEDRSTVVTEDVLIEPPLDDLDDNLIAIAEELSPASCEDTDVAVEACNTIAAAVIATPHVPVNNHPKFDKVIDVDDNHVELDWVGLAEKLLSVIHTISSISHHAEKQGENLVNNSILRSTLEILIWITRTHPSLLSVITNFPKLKHTLFMAIFQTTGSEIRGLVSRAILELCTEAGEPSVTNVVLTTLLPYFTAAKEHATSCSEYFSLMGSLVNIAGALDCVDVVDVLLGLTEEIITRQSTEMSDEDDDFLLQGYLSLTRMILMSLPLDTREGIISLIEDSHNLLDELFYNCLFPKFPIHEYHIPKPKCMSAEGRNLAFNLILEMVEGNPELFLRIMEHISSLHSLDDFDLLCSDKIMSSKFMIPRPKLGYAGLGTGIIMSW